MCFLSNPYHQLSSEYFHRLQSKLSDYLILRTHYRAKPLKVFDCSAFGLFTKQQKQLLEANFFHVYDSKLVAGQQKTIINQMADKWPEKKPLRGIRRFCQPSKFTQKTIRRFKDVAQNCAACRCN